MLPEAADAWLAMWKEASGQGVDLQAVSAFRSVEYQTGIFRGKLDKGLTIEKILAVSAAPGYSEHHSGRAIDIATPGCRPLTEDFAVTPTFGWLQENAGSYGFCMPYDRNNSWEVSYEPWHWFFNKDNES